MDLIAKATVARSTYSTIIFLFFALYNMASYTSSDAAATALADESYCKTTAGTIDEQQHTYEQDGIEAREIAQYIPYYPFKGIDRFYDIGGFLYAPHIFEKIVNIFVNRYKTLNIDIIAGYVMYACQSYVTSFTNILW